jgi:two-component system, LytTR family, sensor kinase
MINPILSRKDYLYIYFTIWAIIAVVHAVILYLSYKIDLNIAVSEGLFFNLIFCGLGISIWYVVRFNTFDNTDLYYGLITHVIAAAFYIFIWLTLGYFIQYSLFKENNNYVIFLNNSLVIRVLLGVVFYSLILVVNYLVLYYNSLQERIIKESELRELVNKAELDNLKSQLNPHFIFNSLNSISSLTMSAPEKAQEMIIKLSTYLRYSLDQHGRQQSKLCEEIANTMLYLEIEKIRFGSRLILEHHIEQDCNDKLLPVMILQPLFENAVKHGVYESTDPITVSVNCRMNKDELIVSVKNNFDPESAVSRRKGIGLKNIRNRLNLIYNRGDLITIKKGDNTFEVILYIPQTA